MEPEPYWMENAEPFALYVDDAVESYLLCKKQAIDVHFVLGTQRLLELRERVSSDAPALV